MSFTIVIFLIAFVVIFLLLGLVLVAVHMGKQNHTASPKAQEPLPGGGGSYTMQIEGMNCDHCKASVEAALNAFEGIRAEADWKTGTARIVYAGYPDLALLERLRKAVEDAGFTVKKIQ